MNDEKQTPRKYKRPDENFKRLAVEFWLQGGKSAAQIALDLGISDQSPQDGVSQSGLLTEGPAEGDFTNLANDIAFKRVSIWIPRDSEIAGTRLFD